MSKGWKYKSGDWNVHCDVCGKKIKAHDAKKRWDGFIVCAEDWEPRHSLDFIKSRPEKIYVDFVRKEFDGVFSVTCDIPSSSSYVGLATADCSRADLTYGMTYNDILFGHLCSEQTKTGIAGIGYAGCCIPTYNSDAYL